MRQVTVTETARAALGIAAVLGVYCAARIVGEAIAMGVWGAKATAKALTMPIGWKGGDR